MTGPHALRERIARLEANQEHMTRQMAAMSLQLAEVHDLLLKAKGARWAIIGIATVGGFIAAKAGSLLPFLR